MTKLFIIGNGFDLAHGMKTNYKDFRQFLIDEYLHGEYDPNAFYDIPYTTTMPDGDEEYCDEDVVKCILKLLDGVIGTNWEDVESYLNDLPYSEFLDSYDLYNKEDDDFISKDYSRNQNNSSNLCGGTKRINYYFREWVETIKIAKKGNKKFKKLIDPKKDFFLNFNYTKTLEVLYKAQNVCHIHGTLEQELLFGHGDSECPYEKYEQHWFGSQENLRDLFFSLQKNTQKAFWDNQEFFIKLQKASMESPLSIYSFGFSFSEVDQYYLSKICEIIDTTSVCFYMNNYDDDKKRQGFSEVLYECGFKGSIDEFYKKQTSLVSKLAMFLVGH